MPGNSKHTFNLVGYYETDRVSVRVAYTRRSKFFVTFDRTTPLNQDGLESLDASVSFNVTDNIRLAIGAENLLDEYPDANTVGANPSGTTSFSYYSPFGRSGRFVYGRVSYKF